MDNGILYIGMKVKLKNGIDCNLFNDFYKENGFLYIQCESGEYTVGVGKYPDGRGSYYTVSKDEIIPYFD